MYSSNGWNIFGFEWSHEGESSGLTRWIDMVIIKCRIKSFFNRKPHKKKIFEGHLEWNLE